MAITRGDVVQVTTAGGQVIPMRALGQPVRGRDFPVLWVSTEAEWGRAHAADEEPDGIPWPVESVHELASA
jgi:hypothetical protein